MSNFGPDNFTTATDKALPTYSANYSRLKPTTGTTYLSALSAGYVAIDVNDFSNTGNIDFVYECVATGSPTADYEQNCQLYNNGAGGNYNGLAARIVDANNYYLAKVSVSGGVELYRYDAGVATALSLTGTPPSVANSASNRAFRFKVSGTNPVNFELQFAGGTTLTASDSTVNRKTSGRGGIALYAGWNDIHIDDYSITDLNSGVTVTPTGFALSMGLGSPTINTNTSVTITPTGFGLTMDLGTFTTQNDITIIPAGFPLSMNVGTPSVVFTNPNVTVTPSGFALSMGLGSPVVNLSQTMEPVGFALTMNVGIPFVSKSGTTTTGLRSRGPRARRNKF